MALQVSSNNLLKKNLTLEYNDTFRVEQVFWKMRSRINWISKGDANTMFFHLFVINIRRRNKVSYFKDDKDQWITNPVQLSDHT